MEKYIELVNAGEMTVTQACKELGISRQTWYSRLKNPKPKKEKVEVAPEIDWAEVEAIEKAEQREWMKYIEEANELMSEFLNKTFPHLWCKLRFEHVDAAAYWYTFELKNDSRRQTWSIRHSDLQKG